MIRYKVSIGFLKIKKVEIIRETVACVFLPSEGRRKERKELKRSDYNNYFDTFNKAKDFLLNNQKLKVDHAKERLSTIEADYLTLWKLVENEDN